MQYVGRLVSSVYNSVPSINPATLSGAIDIIVVERRVEVDDEVPDDSPGAPPGATRIVKRWETELSSTPFHLRFGKMSVLRPAERKVTLHLNNSPDPLPFAMKVGEQGEAFFVLELDEDESRQGIPDDLVTSPILSAASSPDMQPGSDDARGSEEGMEELDLGASVSAAADTAEEDARSATTTVATSVKSAGSTQTAATDVTPPGSARSPSAGAKSNIDEAPDNDEAHKTNMDVPPNSGHTGSGPAGKGTLLGSVGEAASKASGAIGAAGRVLNPRSSKLEKLAGDDQPDDAAPLSGKDDEEHGAAPYDPQQKSEGKDRMQEEDDSTPTQHKQADDTETDRLEQKMQKRAEDLVERAAKSSGETASLDDGEAREEAYPAPFGSSAVEGRRTTSASEGATGEELNLTSKTQPSTQKEHADFLAGQRLPRVDSGIEGVTLSPGQVEPSAMRKRLARQEQSNDSWKTGHSRNQSEDAGSVPRTPRRKEDLQYMLDMDGYKMTADGEDLAFAEGERLSKEMPLSRRHGGTGRHGHSELMDHAGGHRPDQLKRAVAEGSRMRSASRPAYRSGESGDTSIESKRSGHRRGSHSGVMGSESDSRSMISFRDETPPLSVAGDGDFQSDELSLSRDLVRLSRMMRPSEDAADEDDEGRPALARSGRSRRHFQDTSLSDTEADAPTPAWSSSAGAPHQRATSAEGEYASGRAGNVTPPRSGRALDADALARSPEYEWGWGEMPKQKERSAAAAARRARVQSTTVGDAALASRARGIDLERGDLDADGLRRSTTGKLACADEDPYVFLLELDDASHSFELSLCYTEGFGSRVDDQGGDANQDEDDYRFEENRVSFQRFVDDPDLVNDERLVVRYHERFLTWENASAVLATLSFYRKTLSGVGGEEAARVADSEAQPGARPSVWSRWWNRNKSTTDLEAKAREQGDSMLRDVLDPRASKPSLDRSHTDPAMDVDAATQDIKPEEPVKPINERAKPNKTYAKTLRLTSEQLKSLNLKKGPNKITFSVTSSYSGVATCTARIFLWEAQHRIVVSDIDGTITKSDALGHVFTMIGRDWTHVGVAKLYTDIARNGYRIMYLTSRAIGQADQTRDYLKGIKQANYQLPDGPVIMSPDRLMASLHREVILRKPEVFKMACLRDIARLFGHDPRLDQPKAVGPDAAKQWPGIDKSSLAYAAGATPSPGAGAATAIADSGSGPASAPSAAKAATGPASAGGPHPSPFYAGFGNRITDALSYRSVNIPSSRIFTIDSNGEVKMELLELAGYKSSYIHMTDLVDQMFPPITVRSEAAAIKPEYNDFNFWRPSITAFELPGDDELLPEPPVSPALSARSGRSMRSNASVRSGASGEAPKTADEEPRRRSRFGLGSLGLSRRSSAQTIASPEERASEKLRVQQPTHANTLPSSSSAPDLAQAADEPGSPTSPPQRGNSDPSEAASPSSSYGSGVTAWAAPWRRRRAASPNGGGSVQATSPLVGPVITAEPDEDSDAEGVASDDDVSVFGGEGIAEESYRDEEDEQDDSAEARENMGDEVLEDDELLQGGEIRFAW